MIDTAESIRALNGTADVSDAGHSHESNLNSSHGQLEVRSLPAECRHGHHRAFKLAGAA